ncbi:hypothetical protein SELMODRAFT_426503 [Selaginella moellendorffii]|uniref:Uncharacterized protein n=1 Tax=Selaginella moellendorffii TaxID=88036 RepID=D8SWK3_SELML|nr:hypothetical protein SELMODRAFT_426503 [Selaginella moellendorffii]
MALAINQGNIRAIKHAEAEGPIRTLSSKVPTSNSLGGELALATRGWEALGPEASGGVIPPRQGPDLVNCREMALGVTQDLAAGCYTWYQRDNYGQDANSVGKIHFFKMEVVSRLQLKDWCLGVATPRAPVTTRRLGTLETCPASSWTTSWRCPPRGQRHPHPEIFDCKIGTNLVLQFLRDVKLCADTQSIEEGALRRRLLVAKTYIPECSYVVSHDGRRHQGVERFRIPDAGEVGTPKRSAALPQQRVSVFGDAGDHMKGTERRPIKGSKNGEGEKKPSWGYGKLKNKSPHQNIQVMVEVTELEAGSVTDMCLGFENWSHNHTEAIDPGNLYIKLSWRLPLESLRMFEEATEDYIAVLQSQPDDPAAWNNLGNVQVFFVLNFFIEFKFT